MKRVLVTGGAGFIGSHVAEHFARADEEVVIWDNFSRIRLLGKSVSDPLYNWNYLKENYDNIAMDKVDVTKAKLVKQASKGIGVIVHAAGQVAVTASVSDPRTDFEVNALGTFNILEAARQNDCALIFCSTNKGYGENVNDIPLKEEETRYCFSDPTYANGIPESFPIDHTGHSPYGSSKLAADIYVQDYAHTYGLKTGIFRMSCVYGERQFGTEDQGWLAWFTIATLTDKPITIYDDGKQVRDVLHVKDLVDAFDLFLRSSRHDVFNIGGGPSNTLSLLELVDLLRSLARKQAQLSFGQWRGADQKVYLSDIHRVQSRLNWKPRIAPRQGLKRLVNWVNHNRSVFIWCGYRSFEWSKSI
jgi:CDP-paratose 2-epimerase